uniref:Uncharacterized protein n=1 Tax=viral metagenome TaxID=1070528 RepID=A0A6C0J8Y8_9ZZZZ
MSAYESQKYLDKININNIIRPRTGLQIYNNNTLDFNHTNKKLLNTVTCKVLQYFKDVSSFSIGTVKLLLLKKGTYWNYPFTLNNVIVFTPVLFDNTKNAIAEIFIHEMVHIDQKRHPKKYENYYKTLGFRKQSIDFGELSPHLLDNPDGQSYEWIWNDKYVPCAILTPDLQHIPIMLVLSNETEYTIQSMEETFDYNKRFGTLRQLYHPNEITAHIVSDWIYSKKKHNQIDYDALLKVLNNK